MTRFHTLALCALLTLAAGCAVNRDQTAEGAPLARQLTASDHCGLAAPGLIHMPSRQALERFTGLPNQSLAAGSLDNHDFQREHLLVVALGRKSTGGYGLVLEQSRIRDQVLELTMTLRRPGPDELVTQALTTPCTLLAITPDGWQRLRVEGDNLAPMQYSR